jgi:exodeoxyribonuclease VII large subunit
MISSSRTTLAEHKHGISLLESRLKFKPGLLIREKGISLKNRSEWLAMRVKHIMEQQQNVIERLEEQVKLLDPQHILKRGYSITYFDGKPLTDAIELKPGDLIKTQLYKGNIYSEIKSKKE